MDEIRFLFNLGKIETLFKYDVSYTGARLNNLGWPDIASLSGYPWGLDLPAGGLFGVGSVGTTGLPSLGLDWFGRTCIGCSGFPYGKFTSTGAIKFKRFLRNLWHLRNALNLRAISAMFVGAQVPGFEGLPISYGLPNLTSLPRLSAADANCGVTAGINFGTDVLSYTTNFTPQFSIPFQVFFLTGSIYFQARGSGNFSAEGGAGMQAIYGTLRATNRNYATGGAQIGVGGYGLSAGLGATISGDVLKLTLPGTVELGRGLDGAELTYDSYYQRLASSGSIRGYAYIDYIIGVKRYYRSLGEFGFESDGTQVTIVSNKDNPIKIDLPELSAPSCEELRTWQYWTVATFCGDQKCNNGETCSSCSWDCGSCPPVTAK